MKIIEVINAMIEKNERISNVYKNGNEIFFLYNNKYKWSITLDGQNKQEYIIFYYPLNDYNILEISKMDDVEAGNYTFIPYRSADIKTKEATESFAELYKIVSNKIYGIDTIFDDIINN